MIMFANEHSATITVNYQVELSLFDNYIKPSAPNNGYPNAHLARTPHNRTS
jgi:hypothetical protein